MRWLLFAGSIGFALGCAADFAPPGPPQKKVTLTLEPDAALDDAPRALRVHLGLGLSEDEVILFSGELSSYHLGRLRRRDLPKTLLERRVEAWVWGDDERTVLAPLGLLEPSTTYSLARVGSGLLGTFWIRPPEGTAEPLPLKWPDAAWAVHTTRAVFCGDSGSVHSFADYTTHAAPSEHPLLVSAGVGGDLATSSCVTLSFSEPPVAPVLLPIDAGGHALTPAVVTSGEAVAVNVPPCGPGALNLMPGCLIVEDDRARITGGLVPSFWAVRGPGVEATFTLPPGGTGLLRGLTPLSAITLDLFMLDGLGVEGRHTVHVSTTALQRRVIVTEVLANPIGPEPQQEWVELFNAGALPVNLALYRLADAAGEVELPPATLVSGQYALVVREDFDPYSTTDERPAPGTPLLRVPTLGKNGLTNSGETVSLFAPDGALVSSFPARPASKGGRSVARIADALDDDPSGFADHGAPGASPGRENSFD